MSDEDIERDIKALAAFHAILSAVPDDDGDQWDASAAEWRAMQREGSWLR